MLSEICIQLYYVHQHPKLYRKTLALGSLFNKVVDFQVCKFIKRRVQHNCLIVKLKKLLRTSILKNIFLRLLLYV